MIQDSPLGSMGTVTKMHTQ